MLCFLYFLVTYHYTGKPIKHTKPIHELTKGNRIMTRITVHDIFPVVDEKIYQLGTVDMFFYRKRECPLWHKLTPIAKLLCSKRSNTTQPIVNFGSYNNKYKYRRLIHYSEKYIVPYHVTSLTELQKY